jgi:hypothetical protein
LNQEPRDYESPALTVELWTPLQTIYLPLPALKLNPALRIFADPFQGFGTASEISMPRLKGLYAKLKTVNQLILLLFDLIFKLNE